jgi:hypothetical protein
VPITNPLEGRAALIFEAEPFGVAHSLHDLIFERHALQIIFRKPSIGRICIREDSEMVDIADVLACVGVESRPCS